MSRRAAIFAHDDTRQEVIELPEWGEQITVRTAAAIDAVRVGDLMETTRETKDSPAALRALVLLVVYSAVDEEGKPLFEESDVELLVRKTRPPLQRLIDAAMRVNALGDAAALE